MRPLPHSTSHPLYGSVPGVPGVERSQSNSRTTGISIISTPARGDSYRLGETVDVEVTYSEAVTVRGTPLVGLSVKMRDRDRRHRVRGCVCARVRDNEAGFRIHRCRPA